MFKHKKIAVAALFLFISLTAASPINDKLIDKDCNGIKAQKAGSGCGKYPREMYDSLEYEAYDIVCQMSYVGKGKAIVTKRHEDGSREWDLSQPKIIVKLLSILNNEKAKTYLKREVMSSSTESIDNLENKYNNRSEIMIGNAGDYQQQMYWLSANYIVNITWHDTGIPLELITDYKRKYPPSYTFTAEDFDAQKILKDGLQMKFKTINEWEGERGWINRTFDKGEEYISIFMQCNAEMAVRCELDMTDSHGKVGCPAAFMLDDDARKKAYKELQNETEKRNVNIDNVNWRRMDQPKCSRENQGWKLDAQKMLKMDQDDIREAEKFIKKKMGSPTP